MDLSHANDLDPKYYREPKYPREMEEFSSSGFSAAGPLLAGIGVGFAVAMLFAPKGGPELRQQVVDLARNNLGRLRHQLTSLMSRTASFPETGTAEGIAGTDIANLLNEAAKDDLVAVKGIGPVLADRIIGNRPYTTEKELLEKNVIPVTVFRALKRELLSRPA